MIRFIFLLFIVMFSTVLFAATNDRNQPAYLVADSTVLNYKTKVGIYCGHVKMTQGTTVILGDQVTTYSDKNNKLIKAVAIGNLASYSTLPDNSKLFFTAAGQTINYYPIQGFAELIGNAKATQGNDSLAGPHLTYDIKQQTVVSLPAQNEHTTIVIQPSQKLL